MTLVEKICSDLGISKAYVSGALALAHRRYRKIRIKKRTGGERTVVQPSAKLKLIQYWLLKNIVHDLPVHSCATAYRRNVSILSNAARHQRNRYFVKLDFKEFFPSLSFADFLPILRKWHRERAPSWVLTGASITLIERACFDVRSRLPIGYPTSPDIANVIMRKFDSDLVSALARKKKHLGAVIYTRYADDLVFSTNRGKVAEEIITVIRSVIARTKSPRLTINEAKTRIASSSGGSAFVTGLRICNDHHITIHRNYKNHVRLLLSLYRKGRLGIDEHSSVRGHLTHIRHVDPAFFTKLNQKYFDEIAKITPSGRIDGDGVN